MDFDEQELVKKCDEFQKEFDDVLKRLGINDKDREIIVLRAEQWVTSVLMIVTRMAVKTK